MPRKLTPSQFLALAYLDAKGPVTAGDLPMAFPVARSVLARLARKGWAVTDYTITDKGRTALAAARDEARREAGLS